MSITNASVVEAHTPAGARGRQAALAARTIRQRLMNPPNAVPDHGINLRNGWPVKAEAKPEPEPELVADQTQINMELFREEARIFTQPATKSAAKVNEIIKLVAKAYSVSVVDLLSDRRTANVVMPRQIAMWLAKRITLRSLPWIGKRFGDRDHTTVMHAINKIDRLRKSDSAIAAQTDHLIDILQQEAS